MAQIEIKNLTFSYSDSIVLDDVNLQIDRGDFVILCGKSGCGKTTLLRNIKKSLMPFGKVKGQLFVDGTNVNEMTLREDATKIGFVFQNPDHQIVTDKVWHELAFGLENLGINEDEISLRVGEMADYFSLTEMIEQDVEKLSGGQKQLLNIAAVMVMQPDIVILDEPTASLDPISADNLMSAVYKINRDFGTTIIMSEHKLGNICHMANKLIVLEDGKVAFAGEPRKVAMELESNGFFEAMPDSVKIYAKYESEGKNCPLTIGEARKWINERADGDSIKEQVLLERKRLRDKKYSAGDKTIVEFKNVWFRYERKLNDILKGTTFSVMENEVFGIVGGNGAGKSTLLSLISRINAPYRGKINVNGKTSMLVQDVTTLFMKDSVEDEIGYNYINNNKDVLSEFGLYDKLKMHPYDLSGGEQQKLGLIKILMQDPDIIILDEPTKSLDEVFKKEMISIIGTLKRKGKTVIIVSHDLDFVDKCTDRCGLFFNGNMTSVASTEQFFKGNRYYTTEIEKIVRN